jgi:uncharacterized protein YbcC (UPF0753/DUF2309 family)
MQSTLEPHIAAAPDLNAAITEALKRIPPLWPLEHFIAVNPFLGLTDRPFASACSILRRTLGHAPVQQPSDYLGMWKNGVIAPADLKPHTDGEWTTDRLVAALEKSDDAPLIHPVASFADVLDQTLPHAHWSQFISTEIAKWCAVHFDRNQTTWVSPWKHLGLFAAWKSAAIHDAKPEAFGMPGFRAFVAGLPDEPLAVIQRALRKLDPKGVEPADFLHRQLACISGWAGHVQYLVREDELRGQKNPMLLELLAIRLAYDAALHYAFHHDPQVAAAWKQPCASTGRGELDEALARWQAAYETGYQRQLAAKLVERSAASLADVRPTAQAVFCIDVRSEIIRRHLEAALPGTRTLGFAGFFGFPVAHQTAHACKPAPRCPALLVPPIISREERPPQAARQRAEKGAWKAFQNSAASCFTFVESIGLAFGANLMRQHDQSAKPVSAPIPQLAGVSAEEKASLAGNALRGMSLTKNFARLVLLCGHGSHSANNPFGSSLDCGACGGHAGDVNARLAAATLNDPEVRAILARDGIAIPEDTHFLAGRHDTLTDDFLVYETEAVPATHQDELASLQAAIVTAGTAARAERSARLGVGHLSGPALDGAIRKRGTDIAQLRPEWALANNAAFIAAPRARTAGLKLDGRVFLHEYDPAGDPESQVLTAILCAPVVVASWINLQYYGSRIDPANYSAGDKTIHQVVSGIGVIEGNAGDLRGGLPLQSIHDGEKFVHEPRRLTVIIENTPERIDAVLAAHPQVRQLFDHQWIHLIALNGSTAQRRHDGGWVAVG